VPQQEHRLSNLSATNRSCAIEYALHRVAGRGRNHRRSEHVGSSIAKVFNEVANNCLGHTKGTV
jgi:hypothetical protein